MLCPDPSLMLRKSEVTHGLHLYWIAIVLSGAKVSYTSIKALTTQQAGEATSRDLTLYCEFYCFLIYVWSLITFEQLSARARGTDLKVGSVIISSQ